MNKIKYLLVLMVFALVPLNVFSQDVTQVAFISELDSKAFATYGDAVIMFKLQSGGSLAAKTDTSADLYTLPGYSEDNTLSKGMASLMAAKYLNLGGSIMYMIFGSERYAYKACIAHGIFSPDGSEYDRITGPELIELFSKISDIKVGK